MRIEYNKVVEISYEVKVDGKVTDHAEKDAPLDFIQGQHMLIPRLEEALEGKEPGDRIDCIVLPEDAYGDYDLKKVFDIPKNTFEVNGVLREDLLAVGRYVPMLNGQGEVCHALIVDIKEDSVTVDFNLPMAGKTLEFSIEVISVRDASEKELTEGLHGEFLPREERHCRCGGGCGGHHHNEGGCGCHGEDGCGCHSGEGEGGCGCHSDDSEGGCGCHGEDGCGCHSDGNEDGCGCHGEDGFGNDS